MQPEMERPNFVFDFDCDGIRYRAEGDECGIDAYSVDLADML